MFSAFIVLFSFFLVTCNFGQSAPESGLSGEYTDVVYSPDGTRITLYLDGVGVPVTQQQRALTTDMAKMSHDFYEVVFWAYDTNGESIVARAAWEIGQSAGIKGVHKRDGLFYYNASSPPPSNGSRGVANLFAGRKVDKTLLAVGLLLYIIDADGINTYPYMNSSTKSVTFEVGAITSKLDIDTNERNNPGNIASSFITASGDENGLPVYNNVPYYNPFPENTIAEKVSLGGVDYPYYKLPKSDYIAAQYEFLYPFNYNHIRMIIDDIKKIKPEVIRREPRFLSGERYYYVQQAKLDTVTTVDFDKVDDIQPYYDYYFADGNSAQFIFPGYRGIRFVFDTSNSQGGIFSFTFRIPVYNITRDPSTNGGGSFTTWYIQPGFGRDLYSLDNGKDAGGCILMGTGDFGDWMDIFTAGMPW